MAETTQPYVWSAIGGHLALDLGNTVSWRLDPARAIERLTDPEKLVDWYVTVADDADRARLEADAAAHPRIAATALRTVQDIRDATTRIIDAHVDRSSPAPDDMTTVTDAWVSALGVAMIPASLPLSPRIEVSTTTDIVASLALSVADLLGRRDLSTLRRCDGPDCGWLFLDTTRNHSRRWCDPFDCGNRARVRSYAQRHRAAGNRRATPP